MSDNYNPEYNTTDNDLSSYSVNYDEGPEDRTTAKRIETLDNHVFMDHAYNGTHGFRDGTYLVPHKREMYYITRRKTSFYRNFFKPIVRAMLDPVFGEDIERVVTANGSDASNDPNLMFNVFIEDCDNSGNSLHSFTHTTVEDAIVKGVSFVVMDNFSEEEQRDLSAQDAIDERIMPYVYMRKISDVLSYKTDRFGKLESITFHDVADENDYIRPIDSTNKTQKPARFRRFDENTVVVLEESKGQDGKMVLVPVETYEHNLGEVPVYPVITTNKEEPGNLRVDPPLYDLAKMNWAVFNKDSEIRELERNTMFPIFYIFTDDLKSITLGTSNVLQVPTQATKEPGFAAPPAEIVEALDKNRQELVSDLYRIAQQNGVTGVTEQSGVAKQWDFAAHEEVLRKISQTAADLELWVADMFKKYTEEEFEYSPQYPYDFAPNDSQGELDKIDQVIDMNPGVTATKELKKDAVRIQLDRPSDKMEEIYNEIDSQTEDMLLAQATETLPEDIN